METSRSLNPTYEKTRLPSEGTCSLKAPVASVAVPPLPPLTFIDTPASACPEALSVTTPLTVTGVFLALCAFARKVNGNRKRIIRNEEEDFRVFAYARDDANRVRINFFSHKK